MAGSNTGFDIRQIFDGNTTSNAKTKENTVIDSDWVKSRFLVPDNDLKQSVRDIRYGSTASLKFTDTSIGGSVFINPRPQFNALTDPKPVNYAMGYVTPTLDPNQKGSMGMGEGYSRLIDDNQQVVFMEFGLPKFNSLIDFFFRAVDYTDSVLANTGRPSTAYNIGKMTGAAVGLIAFPILSVTVYMGKIALGLVYGEKALKFYYFNSKMEMYWSGVNTLVTQLVTEQGLLSPMITPDKPGDPPKDITLNQIGVPVSITQADIDNINEIMPKAISKGTNYIDVFGIVTKAQRAAMKQRETIYKRVADGSIDSPNALALSAFPAQTLFDTVNHYISFSTYLADINKHDSSKGDTKVTKPPVTQTKAVVGDKIPKFTRDNVSGTYSVKKDSKLVDYVKSAIGSFDSGLRNGGQYAVFGVDYTGPTSESFSNSVTTINIGDKAKQIAGRSRTLSYDLARGNAFGDTLVQDGLTAISDLLKGVVAGVTFNLTNVISSLTGNAYVEIPKRWEDSSMTFQQNTYAMSMISPYNTFLCQLQNMYLPTCMLLNGIIPLATGKSSYTSPYLCTSFCKGVENVKLGMMTSLTLKRGTSNLGFDKKHNPLAIDASWTVTDFSTLITSGVNSSIFSKVFKPIMEDDTPLGNYMAMLGGRDIITSKYSTKRLPQRLSNVIMNIEQTFSADRIGFLLSDTLSDTIGSVVSARSLPTLLTNR